MSSTTDMEFSDRLNQLVQFAKQNPVKFVALSCFVVTGAVPVGAFLLYATGTVVCTVVAAIVLDLALLAVGVFGLATALCFVGCITGGVAALFSLVYLGYKAAVGSLNRAKASLTPSTVTPSPGTNSEGEETLDKNKHPGVMVWGLPTGLSSFLTGLFSLTAHDCNDTDTDADVRNSDHDDDKQSNICKTSLIVFGLTSAVVIMSYTVLLAAYAVVNFT